jgi:hypothetical protein
VDSDAASLRNTADYHYARFADYLAALDRAPPALNAACLVGHSTLRVGAMSALDRPADKAEVAQVGERLQEALDAGAIGLSSGLAYAPASHMRRPPRSRHWRPCCGPPGHSTRRICATRPIRATVAPPRSMRDTLQLGPEQRAA